MDPYISTWICGHWAEHGLSNRVRLMKEERTSRVWKKRQERKTRGEERKTFERILCVLCFFFPPEKGKKERKKPTLSKHCVLKLLRGKVGQSAQVIVAAASVTTSCDKRTTLFCRQIWLLKKKTVIKVFLLKGYFTKRCVQKGGPNIWIFKKKTWTIDARWLLTRIELGNGVRF